MNFQRTILFFHIITKLEKIYNGYENHIVCVWRYLQLGDYRGPQSPWQEGGGEKSPRYWWSGHCLITTQTQGNLTVSGAIWPQVYPELSPLTHYQDLRPHQPGVVTSPGRPGCCLNTEIPGQPGDSLAWSPWRSSVNSGLGRVCLHLSRPASVSSSEK